MVWRFCYCIGTVILRGFWLAPRTEDRVPDGVERGGVLESIEYSAPSSLLLCSIRGIRCGKWVDVLRCY